MNIRWSRGAQRDVERLYRFLAAANPRAARDLVRTLRAAPQRLLTHPRIGPRIDEFGEREVRRMVVGQYELQYELIEADVVVFRIWHSREDR